MQSLVAYAKERLKPLGFRKQGVNFTRMNHGYIQAIAFQRCSFAEGYYINIGIHPIGIPSLKLGRDILLINSSPKATECTISQRAEQVCDAPNVCRAKDGSLVFGVFPEYLTEESYSHFDVFLSSAIPEWQNYWSNDRRIINADYNILGCMFPLIPNLWHECVAILKCFCSIRLGNLSDARSYLHDFDEMTGGCYSQIHSHLNTLLNLAAGVAEPDADY